MICPNCKTEATRLWVYPDVRRCDACERKSRRRFWCCVVAVVLMHVVVICVVLLSGVLVN